MTPKTIDSRALARTFELLVDVLIPGDADFPSGSSAGSHGLVMDRIREQLGPDAFPTIMARLDAGASFADSTGSERIEKLAALECDDPDLFAFLRFATYFSYYQMPPVIAALRALGHDYNDAPQPLGYVQDPFDPARDLPVVPRGSYKKTESIERIDLSPLADLQLPARGN